MMRNPGLSAKVSRSPAPQPRVGAGAMVMLLLCALAYFLDGMTNSIMGAVAPGIARTLSVGPKELGPVFSAALVGQSIGLLFVSMASLRVGHRPVVIASVLSFGVFEACAGLAGSVDQLIVFRFLTGVGLGGALPSCMALASEAFPAARRGVVVMTVFVGFALGNSLAGFLAAAFIGPAGWRTVLLINGGLSSLAGIAIWLRLAESPEFLARRAGRLSGVANLRDQSVIAQLLSPSLLIGTLMIWVFFVCSQLVAVSVASWLPVMLEKAGRAPVFAALAISAFSLGGLCASLIVGWLMDRFGAIKVTLVLIVCGAMCFFLAGPQLREADRLVLQLEVFVIGFFSQGAYGAINVVVTHRYPAALRATGLGWAKGVSRLGAIGGPIVLGYVLAAEMAPEDVLRVFAVPELIAAAALAVLGLLPLRR